MPRDERTRPVSATARDGDEGSANLADVVRALRRGGVVAYPTEAVFGLGCDPGDAGAVARLLELKRRDVAQGVLLIAAELAQLEPFIDLARIPVDALARALATWPGPHTWILPARADVPAWIVGAHEGIAVRLTAHAPAAGLCRAFAGALVSTSANRHGEAPAKTVDDVEAMFGGQLDAILNGSVGGLERPTPIRDAISGMSLRD